MKVAAIILLAGRSERFDSNTPKQFFPINGKPLIYYTIYSFEKVSEIDEITLVSRKEDIAKVQNIVKEYGFKKVIRVIEGGETRNESVHNGLKSLSLSNDDLVLIHDGARPIVPEKVILSVIHALENSDAVTTAIKVEDTIVFSENSHDINSFENRDEYFRIQTPQGFRFETILKAHENIDKNATDDAQLVQRLGIKVKLVDGDKKMNKITTIEDINALKVLIENEHL